jgi:hypothetical protein
MYSNPGKSQPTTIDILSISSTVNDDRIHISWEISNYENHHFIVVERSSNAVDFSPLDTLNMSDAQTNIYCDVNPIHGMSYYRIKYICGITKDEIVSNITYVEYKAIQKEAFEILKMYPMPFSDKLSTNVRCRSKMMIKLTLTDPTGSLIYESEKMCSEGINTIECNEILKTGNSFYYLTLSDENSHIKTIQLLKQYTN